MPEMTEVAPFYNSLRDAKSRREQKRLPFTHSKFSLTVSNSNILKYILSKRYTYDILHFIFDATVFFLLKHEKNTDQINLFYKILIYWITKINKQFNTD